MKALSMAVLLFPACLLPLMGCLPALTMDRLADMGQSFLVEEGLEHGVAYFHWGNLKGGLCSIGIGLVLYVVLVRRGLMVKGRYVDRWPKVLDLENLLYRPILQKALPGIFGAVFGWFDRYIIDVPLKIFLIISAVVCRGMDHLADGIILLARKTSHRQVSEKGVVSERYWLARKLGKVLDVWSHWKGLFTGKKEGSQGTSQALTRLPELIEWEASWKKTGRLIMESFSFGLMLFCIGLCLTLGYLFYVFLR